MSSAAMDDVRIRAFETEDRPALLGLVRELQATQLAHYDRMKPPNAIGDDYIDSLLKACRGSKGTILVAVDGGPLVGYAVVLTAVSSEDEEDEVDFLYAYVSELMVTQRYRGRGIGANLLARCEELAREAGVRWIRVTALSDNADAVRTYERAGFRSLLTVMEKPLSG